MSKLRRADEFCAGVSEELVDDLTGGVREERPSLDFLGTSLLRASRLPLGANIVAGESPPPIVGVAVVRRMVGTLGSVGVEG